MNNFSYIFAPAFPEFFLIIASNIFFIFFKLFQKFFLNKPQKYSRNLINNYEEKLSKKICTSAQIILIITLILNFQQDEMLHLIFNKIKSFNEMYFTFNGFFFVNNFIRLTKFILLIPVIIQLEILKKLDQTFLKRTLEKCFFMMSAILGAFFLFSSNNLFILIISLEIISANFLLMINDSFFEKKSSAGVKYFIFSSFGSIFLLFGVILIYLKFQTLDHNILKKIFEGIDLKTLNKFTQLPLFLIIIGASFKLFLVPMHSTTMQIYNDTNSTTKFFIDSFIKIIFISFAIKFYNIFEYRILHFPFIIFGSIILFISSLNSLHQNILIKNFSLVTLNNIGFYFIVIGNTIANSFSGIIIFILMETVNSLIFMIINLTFSVGVTEIKTIKDLSFISEEKKYLKIFILLFIFSIYVLPLSTSFIPFLIILKNLFSSYAFISVFIILFSKLIIFKNGASIIINILSDKQKIREESKMKKEDVLIAISLFFLLISNVYIVFNYESISSYVDVECSNFK